MAQLKIIELHKDAYFFDLSEDETSIGRSSDNDLTIADPLLSRKHLTIIQRDNEYYLRDNDSKNGTLLNGNRIKKEEKLKDQHLIKIGQTTIYFLSEKEEEKEVKYKHEADFDTSSTQMFPIKTLLTDYEKKIKPSPIDEEALPLAWQNQALITLKDFSLELLSHRHLQDILENVMDFVGRIIPVRRGVLMLKEDKEGELSTKVTRYFEGENKKQQIKISRTIINSVLEKKASLLTVDAQFDERFNSKESIIAQNIHSAMCLPLWNNKEVIGLIYLDRSLGEKSFNKEELYLMSSLANLAAIKIENTKLFEEALEKRALEEQLSLAAEIQKSLLPRECPVIEGLDIAASHIPCSYVGGDYYDFFALPDGKLGITIADVAGKGAGGALLMATLRAALASQLTLKTSLQDLFYYLNNFIYYSSASNKYITFFYGEIDTKSGLLNYINAGHNPPRIISKNKKVIELPPGGMSLGFFPDSRYEDGLIELKNGDILVLFTDGITERINTAGEEFKEERMVNLIKNNRKENAQKLLDITLDAIEEFAHCEPQNDDITMVILKKL
jgi:sigma-B regulation protein RsbU (phosphoserine phosphatase)